jgi:hypothetical protein
MPSAGFEPAILAIRRLHIYVLDRTANGIGLPNITSIKYLIYFTIKWFVRLVKMFFTKVVL